MSTAAASGEISEGKSLSYDQIVKSIGSLESKLDGIMSIMKEVNVKLEQQDLARKRAALVAQRVALRRAIDAKKATAVVAPLRLSEEEVKKKKEEEEAKRKKLEELKSRLQEVKSKLGDAKKQREASATVAPTGKGNVGEVAEEKSPVGAITGEAFPPYWKEIIGASDKFKSLGLLSG
jgi:chromosome segregation ATPase